MCKLNNEVWKDIKGYEGLYQIPSCGRVKSLSRVSFSGKSLKTKILRLGTHRQGYLGVNLYSQNNKKYFLVHRLVAEMFIFNPDPELFIEVNHKNGIKGNNCVDNLEWVSPSENHRHAYRKGLRSTLFGETQGNSKLTEEQVIKIKMLLKEGTLTQRKIAELFGVYNTTISAINTNKTWSHVKI